MKEMFSISPSGEKFQIPKAEEYDAEFEMLKKRVQSEREKGREIVVVMGVGFVGAVMAAIEPIFGHLKTDNRMGRNYLKDQEGDHINALLCGCGFNQRIPPGLPRGYLLEGRV